MPRKKTWRVALVKKGSRGKDDIRLVDPGHMKNRTRDPTINVTVDGPVRLVETGHVKNSSKDLGDTASLKRVQNLPSGAMNHTDLPLGAMNLTDLPSGATNLNTDLPSGATNSKHLPSESMNAQCIAKQSADLPSCTNKAANIHSNDCLKPRERSTLQLQEPENILFA